MTRLSTCLRVELADLGRAICGALPSPRRRRSRHASVGGIAWWRSIDSLRRAARLDIYRDVLQYSLHGRVARALGGHVQRSRQLDPRIEQQPERPCEPSQRAFSTIWPTSGTRSFHASSHSLPEAALLCIDMTNIATIAATITNTVAGATHDPMRKTNRSSQSSKSKRSRFPGSLRKRFPWVPRRSKRCGKAWG